MQFSELSPQAANIVAKFTLATTAEVVAGQRWYSESYEIAKRIALLHDLSPVRVSAVIAALSPNNRWERNIQDAENVITAFVHGEDQDVLEVKCCTYTANKLKALAILKSESLDYEDILKGPKVIEFFHCITEDSHFNNDVCIDGHAYSIWYGSRLTMKEVPNIGKKLRERIKQDYNHATWFINQELGVDYLASQVQAITWVCHRRIYGI